MTQYGNRDGLTKVRCLQLGQKRLKYDIFPYYASASGTKLCSAYAWLNSTAATTFQSTPFSAPRNVDFINHMGGAAERKVKVMVKGYNAQGEYNEEFFELSSAADGTTVGSVAWAYIASVKPLTSTKGYGTYGSVSMRLGNKIGFTEYCEGIDDVKTLLVGTSKGFTGSAYLVGSATLFNKTYQTLNLAGYTDTVTGSVVGLVYLSKFQKRLGDE